LRGRRSSCKSGTLQASSVSKQSPKRIIKERKV
jgi:hypothetical protein